MRRPLLALLLILTLVGCGQPRQPIVGRDEAESDRREHELRVIKAFDAIRLPYPTASSHLVEVEVLVGPPDRVGRVVTLPYDEWAMGGPPPERGQILRTTPRRWVLGDGSSRGKPFSGWDAKR
jgi:hypothetical protein